MTFSAIAQFTATFNFTGAMQTWVVPPGVTTVTIECWGAQGEGGNGGLGGYASGDLSVTPGQTLHIFVGGQNGFNGGGMGHAAVLRNGGGASDVRVNGTSLTDRIIVAGGGGGGGFTDAGPRQGGHGGGGMTGLNYAGGGGGEGYGGPGENGGLLGGAGNTSCHAGGGGGGGLNSGGGGSCNTCYSGTCGQNGSFGLGGDGDTWENGICYNSYGGTCGGGGGYYGGGGTSVGNCGGGGGGGGSSWTGTLTNNSLIGGQRSGNGRVIITYQFCMTIMGALTNDDMTQTGRLFRNGVSSSCAVPKVNPGPNDMTPGRNYDAYSFYNSSVNPICVTTHLSTSCGTNLFFLAYLNTFNPASPSSNYLADPGSSSAGISSFSFILPANSTVIIVVHTITPGITCSNYTLSIDRFCCDLDIIDVASTPISCTGNSDGTITVDATCTFCSSLEYSLDDMNWQPTNVFTGLAPGIYSVYVRDIGDPACKDETTAEVGEAPSPNVPTGITSTVLTATSAYIDWDDSPNADRWQVRYRKQGTATWTTTANLFVSNTTLMGLIPNIFYQYQVRARCTNANNSAWSATQTFFTNTCFAPTGLEVSNISNNSVLATWNAAAGAISYMIRYRKIGQGWTLTSSASTSKTLTGLLASTNYEVQVASFCTSGAGGWSASVFFTTAGAKTSGQALIQGVGSEQVDWMIFPNPAQSSQTLTIQLTNSQSETGTLSILNLQGRVLLRQNWKMEQGFNQLALDNLKLHTGLYFVTIRLSDQVLTKRLIIQE